MVLIVFPLFLWYGCSYELAMYWEGVSGMMAMQQDKTYGSERIVANDPEERADL
jgi:hypothetical protein